MEIPIEGVMQKLEEIQELCECEAWHKIDEYIQFLRTEQMISDCNKSGE